MQMLAILQLGPSCDSYTIRLKEDSHLIQCGPFLSFGYEGIYQSIIHGISRYPHRGCWSDQSPLNHLSLIVPSDFCDL